MSLSDYRPRNVTPPERLLLFLATVLLVICVVMEYQTYDLQRTTNRVDRIVQNATSGPAVEAQQRAFNDFLERQKSMEERQQRIEMALCGGPCPDVVPQPGG